MNKKRYKLISNEIKKNAVVYMAELPLDPLMEVIFQEYQDSGTLQQIRFIRGVVYQSIQKSLLETHGKLISLGAIHSDFMSMFVPPKIEPGLNGEPTTINRSMATMTKRERSDYIMHLDIWTQKELGDEYIFPVVPWK